MAQHDYVIANGTGAAVRSDLNSGLAAIVSQNSGATEPTTTYAYMRWADTATGVMKMRNGANNAWITLYQLDGEWSTIAFENGSAAAPSIYFKDSGTDTGIYSPGADQVGISTGGTARITVDGSGNVNIDSNTLYVDAANNRVGIGTSSPGKTLDVNGESRFTVATTVNNAAAWYTAGDPGGYLYLGNGIGTPASIESYTPSSRSSATELALRFKTVNTSGSAATAMTIDSSQRVGIGTTSPTRQLDVRSTVFFDSNGDGTGTSPSIAIGSTSVGLSYVGGGHLSFTTGSAEKARIDSSGRLLVGTSSAATTDNNANSPNIQLEGADGDASRLLVRSNAGTTATAGPIIYLSRSRGTTANSKTSVAADDLLGSFVFEGTDGTADRRAASISAFVDGTPGASDMPGRLVFSTTADGASSPTERMRITSTGEIWTGTNMLQRYNNNSLSSWSYDTGTSTGVMVFVNLGTAGDGAYQGVSLGKSATSWGTYSDERGKTNLAPIENGLLKVSNLRAVTGRYLEDKEHTSRSFLIAQDVQAVLPEAVDNGDPDKLTLRYTEVIPLLVAALKESKERIEALEAKVAALEAQ